MFFSKTGTSLPRKGRKISGLSRSGCETARLAKCRPKFAGLQRHAFVSALQQSSKSFKEPLHPAILKYLAHYQYVVCNVLQYSSCVAACRRCKKHVLYTCMAPACAA